MLHFLFKSERLNIVRLCVISITIELPQVDVRSRKLDRLCDDNEPSRILVDIINLLLVIK